MCVNTVLSRGSAVATLGLSGSGFSARIGDRAVLGGEWVAWLDSVEISDGDKGGSCCC
jgi:hypothetical protein